MTTTTAARSEATTAPTTHPVSLMQNFRGLTNPSSMSGVTLSRILIILLLLVPQIAQTKVTKSKGK